MATPPLPRPPEDRKQHHEWFNPQHNGYPNLDDYESCKKCGIVKNERNALACTCPGRVMITFR